MGKTAAIAALLAVIAGAGGCGRSPPPGGSGPPTAAVLGQPCMTGTDCDAGTFCVEGVCCDLACDAPCVGCTIPGRVGTCSPRPPGSEAGGRCPPEPVTTCGRDGRCDGRGLCALHPDGTACSPVTSCTGGAVVGPTCNGRGQCLESPRTCAPYLCDAAGRTCRTGCASDADCADPAVCRNGACTSSPPGMPCRTNAECASGFCAQGVCCDTACAGVCVSCALVGSEGLCTSVPDGLDPFNQCAERLVRRCGTDGVCDGAGECRLYADGTRCAPRRCVGATVTLTSFCDGTGACESNGGYSCAPYQCAAGGDDCATSCASDGDCVAPNVCMGGLCGQRPPGDSCATPDECASGFCEQGVCCTTACGDVCRSCSLPETAGLCTNVPAGGADLQNRCPMQTPDTCGTTGLCDGNADCALYPAETMCGAPRCSHATAITARFCDGGGVCLPPTVIACEPYLCAGTSCALGCTNDDECADPSHSCNAGSCGLKPIGVPCADDGQCVSGHCADGICCDTACGDRCVACAIPGHLGVCSSVPSGGDPRDDCADHGPGSCTEDGTCDGTGGCRLYAQGTVCSARSCVAGTATPEGICDGQGNCMQGPSYSCDDYQCSGPTCGTSCATDLQCVPPAVCINGSCGPKPPGALCSAAGDCASGFCEQGVCCLTACVGICRSCALQVKLGVCTNIMPGTDPLGQCADQGAATCGTNGSCNGNGACQRYPNGTQCAPPTCTGPNTARPQGSCVAGVCSAPPEISCGAYLCAAGACRYDCDTNLDCVGQPCTNGRCEPGPPGTPCTAPGQCASGICAQGVCCTSTCTGACRSCAVPGSEGTCANALAGSDPGELCPTQPPSTCGLDGQCDGEGACRRYPDGTQCSDNTCAPDLRHVQTGGICSDGICTASSIVVCFPFICEDGLCLTSCDADADCQTPLHCAEGTCVDPVVLCAQSGLNVIMGTAGDDVLIGTAGGDCIMGLGGQDDISGLDGDDLIFGGDGNDRIDGGDGNDRLVGDADQDVIQGGPGADFIRGDADDDQLFGGPGDDIMDGGFGGDRMSGEEGGDSLQGSNGIDQLLGGPGNDLLLGGNQSDSLDGADDNDVIEGNEAGDTLLGGEGHDILIDCQAPNSFDGGGGVNTCELNPANAIRVNCTVESRCR